MGTTALLIVVCVTGILLNHKKSLGFMPDVVVAHGDSGFDMENNLSPPTTGNGREGQRSSDNTMAAGSGLGGMSSLK